MSTTTLPRGIPAPRRTVRRRPATTPASPWASVRSLWASIWTTLRAAAVHTRVWAGRLIRWFAAEPGRIRAAMLGVVACAATGAVVGVAAGVVVARIVDLVLGLVEVP